MKIQLAGEPKRPGASTMKKNTHAQFSSLADHLDHQRDALLKRWRITTEQSPGVSIASTLTRVQFNDHIPGLLDAFILILHALPDPPSRTSQHNGKEQILEHGLQRWHQGYQLRDLTREWGHLHLCVMTELDHYAIANPNIEIEVMAAARQAWTKLCWDGISDSTAQYWRLNQAEATGHVRDLEQALSTLNELDRTRAATWRETAHDLQGGLSLVTMASSVLERQNLSESARHEFSDLVQRGVSSLHDLLNDFMCLARLDAGLEHRNLTTFDAATLLTDFCSTSQPLARSRGLFLKMSGPQSLPIEGDQAKIQRILQNLLLNALRYTERGGVTVIWKPVSDNLTDNWMFCVQDTGPGLDDSPEAAPLASQIHEATQSAQASVEAQPDEISSADLSKAPTLPSLTNPQNPDATPSEGVGLSIVKRLCELLNASIELETSPGKGSTFRVILPREYHDARE